MRLIPAPLVIGEEDGFDKPVIDRTEFGNFLTNLVRGTKEPLVIAIDGRWGEGKSTFVKIWQNQLECRGKWKCEAESQRIPALYIDAFKIESRGDVFASLISEIDSFVVQRCGNTAYLDAFRKSSVKIGAKIVPIVARQMITSGLIRSMFFRLASRSDWLKSVIENRIGGAIESSFRDWIKLVADLETSVAEFEYQLKRLPSAIKDNPKGQLVIVVDELDRCNPKYAVEILEKIKHFFTSDNIKFVLVVNMQQLAESIRSVYGSNTNATEYLQKFIDIEARLPRVNHGVNPDPEKFCSNLMRMHDLSQGDELNRDFVRFVSDFASFGNLSLREIERVFRVFVLSRLMFGNLFDSFKSNFNMEWLPNLYPAFSYACLINVIDKDQFRSLLKGRGDETTVRAFCSQKLIGLPGNSQLSRDIEIVALLASKSHDFKSGSSNRLHQSLSNTINSSNLDREHVFPRICHVINGFQDS